MVQMSRRPVMQHAPVYCGAGAGGHRVRSGFFPGRLGHGGSIHRPASSQQMSTPSCDISAPVETDEDLSAEPAPSNPRCSSPVYCPRPPPLVVSSVTELPEESHPWQGKPFRLRLVHRVPMPRRNCRRGTSRPASASWRPELQAFWERGNGDQRIAPTAQILAELGRVRMCLNSDRLSGLILARRGLVRHRASHPGSLTEFRGGPLPITVVRNLQAPVLILYGTADELVNVRKARAYERALQEAGETFTSPLLCGSAPRAARTYQHLGACTPLQRVNAGPSQLHPELLEKARQGQNLHLHILVKTVNHMSDVKCICAQRLWRWRTGARIFRTYYSSGCVRTNVRNGRGGVLP